CILVKFSWHIPDFPIYSNGTKPGTLQGLCGIQTFPRGLAGYMKPFTLARGFLLKKKLKQKTVLSMLPEVSQIFPSTQTEQNLEHFTDTLAKP
ncbi:hypothetical protein, partial [Corynebacterium accolens]|uniref:hypothetical protein n=1 Tax=Corynebacterium accolens TaxID=38284 RepID=UPI00254A9660